MSTLPTEAGMTVIIVIMTIITIFSSKNIKVAKSHLHIFLRLS